MKVTIIGAGNMGRAIGHRAVAGGHDVEVIDRSPDDARTLADELGERATAVDSSGEIGGAVVVLALYYASLRDAVEQYRDRLAGKTVVDICVPLDWETMDGFVIPGDTSAAEELQEQLPDSRVVKAFSTTFARTLASGEKDGTPLDVPIAGDDEEAKRQVATLVEDGGMRPLDVGPLRRARQIEHAAYLQISLQEPLGSGFASALKFLT